jgi:iron complex outermembrane receptor protein
VNKRLAAAATVAAALGIECPLAVHAQSVTDAASQTGASQTGASQTEAPQTEAPQPPQAASTPAAAPATASQTDVQDGAVPTAAAPVEGAAVGADDAAAQGPASTAIDSSGPAPDPASPPASPGPTSEAHPADAAAPAGPPAGGAAAAAAAPPPSPSPSPSLQSQPPATMSSDDEGIATVVVTARRTAENSQNVPVAISAFSGKDLERQQITNAQSLQGLVPSMVVSPGSQQRGIESPTIRGQGSTLGSAPGVIIYYDEVPVPSDYFSNAQGGPGKFFDLKDLQILKGPQGTLFGKNTTGGALLLEPQEPKDYFFASLKADTSTYNGRGVEAILNQPLIDDTLSMRLGFKYTARDGYTRDVATGVDYDNENYWTARLGVLWKPTTRLSNYFLAYYTNSENHGTSDVIEGINSEGINNLVRSFLKFLPPTSQLGCRIFDLAAQSSNCGQDIVAAQQARGIRQVQLSANPNQILTTGATIDKINFDITDGLTLRNIASWSFMKYHYRWDQDGSRLALNDIANPDDVNGLDQKNYTEELQLQGKARHDRLKFVAGGYYDYMGPSGSEQFNDKSFLVTLPPQSSLLSHRSYGPYAQATYDFGDLFDTLDGLKLTLGGRYTTDKVEDWSKFFGEHSSQFKGNAVTYTAGLDYKIGHNLIYAKVSRGYKSGGVEPTATTPSLYSFQPEYVLDYELGQKSDFFVHNMPVRINSDIYYSNYSNMQRPSGDLYAPPNSIPKPGEAIYNAGKAFIAGFEFDGTIQPMEGFDLNANYSYTYGKYRQYDLVVGGLTPQLDCSGQLIPVGQIMHLQCMPFTSVPRHQFSVTARYRLPVPASIGRVDTSATYAWIDRMYSAATTLPEVEPASWLPSYGVLNASVNWSNIGGSPLSLQFYGTNLTDRTYRISNSNVWTLLFFQSSIYGEPRILGMSLSYSWGE